MIKETDPAEIQVEHQKGRVKLLDVRTPGEFLEISIPGAVNIQLEDVSLESVAKRMDLEKDESLYVICRSGKRSMMACHILEEQGASWDLVNVNGGMLRWINEGYPTEENSNN